MEEQEYKELDRLLGKLRSELGGRRFMIISDYLGECPYLSVYDNNGNLIDSITGASIKDCVESMNLPVNQ